jgi:hypothetical protein
MSSNHFIENMFLVGISSLAVFTLGCVTTIPIGFEAYYSILERRKRHEAKYPKMTNKCNHPDCPSNNVNNANK